MASSARWGVLRLVRDWLEPQPARERRGVNQLDAVVDDPQLPPDLTLVWQADAASGLRAASVALREALTEWREAERSLVATAGDPGGFARAQIEVRILRAAYQRRFEAVRARLIEE